MTREGRSGLAQPKFRHRAVAVGGTFDILHVGHERLLAKAFELGELVFVGLTGDRLVSRMNKNHQVRRFAVRRRDLRRLLKTRGWLERARITELRDPFGPATRRKRLDALVVSKETRANGIRMNVLRRRQGLKPLRLYVVRMVRDDDGRLISDTRIRRGEIDAKGKVGGKAARRIC
jgi:pantetheine-phosphate adenylyltransferase